MIFDEPTTFEAALEHQLAKQVLPTAASSAEIAALPAAIRERAFFSARTTHAGYLTDAHDLITRLISPELAAPGQSLSIPEVRTRLKEHLASIGYQPDPRKRGTIQDLSSDRRINLIIDTQTKMSRGYGQWLQGQSPAVLDQWPAQELYRLEARIHERDWNDRWVRAGGHLAAGRMVALKSSPIWLAISAFGNPYPPYDFRSGMDIMDVDRDDAVSLGLVGPTDTVAPHPRALNETLQTDVPAGAPAALVDALLAALGPQVQRQGDTLTLSPGRPA